MLPLAALSSQNGLWALCFAVGAGGLLTVLSRKCHLPTIVFLLLAGFAFGPEGLGILDSSALGEQLTLIVSLAIGLILFEGGLTLDFKGFTQTSPIIRRLLTVGVLTTWLGVSITVYLIFKTSGSFALLMGSLVIVTGPTVIVPMLRRIRTHQRLCSILHWEGVLIDSIGVFIAILCFEWAVEGGGAVALPNFILRIISGIGLGTLGGYGIYWMLDRGWVPSKNVNAFSLASALLIFGTTELIKPEAGLLAVTIAGLVVGIKKPAQLAEVKAFKAEIVDLLIGMLFLLLVSRLEFSQFENFFNQGGVWVLLSVILVVRPLSILISSRGTSLNWREKTLLSWVAPRGVVAASMASLFALSLSQQENPVGDPELMESFVYSVICATVLLQGLSAGLVARLLGVQRPAPNDWLFIGAHRFGRELAHTLIEKNDQSVILIDTNARNIELAREEGLLALQYNGMQAEELYDDVEALYGIGYVLALTDNVELNQLIMLRWTEMIDRDRIFGWIPREHASKEEQVSGQAVFRDLPRPTIAGIQISSLEYKLHLQEASEDRLSISEEDCPLFLVRGKQIKVLSSMEGLMGSTREGDQILSYQKNKTRTDSN